MSDKATKRDELFEKLCKEFGLGREVPDGDGWGVTWYPDPNVIAAFVELLAAESQRTQAPSTFPVNICVGSGAAPGVGPFPGETTRVVYSEITPEVEIGAIDTLVGLRKPDDKRTTFQRIADEICRLRDALAGTQAQAAPCQSSCNSRN